jgi:hypothetical protein
MPPAKRTFNPPEALPVTGDRWVASRKAALIEAVRGGAITLEEACRRYQLSPEEFVGWLAAFEKHGVHGLRVTRFQIYRDKPRSTVTSSSQIFGTISRLGPPQMSRNNRASVNELGTAELWDIAPRLECPDTLGAPEVVSNQGGKR